MYQLLGCVVRDSNAARRTKSNGGCLDGPGVLSCCYLISRLHDGSVYMCLCMQLTLAEGTYTFRPPKVPSNAWRDQMACFPI
jgi:hypothetical protein